MSAKIPAKPAKVNAKAESETPKNYFTAQELAGLPGMPSTVRAIQIRAQKCEWDHRPRQGRGGGREYAITALPAETRDYLLDRMIAALPQKNCDLPTIVETGFKAPAKLVEKLALPAIETLKGWQRQTMDARLAILRATEELAKVVGMEGAVERMVKDAAAGQLPDCLQALVPVANKCSGDYDGKRTLSRPTLYRWRSLWKKEGLAALAPKSREKNEVPDWTPFFLDAYRKFSRPSIPRAMEEMKKTIPAHIQMPCYDTIDRWMKKFSRLEIQKGRRTGSELKAMKSFTRRDLSEFLPGDIAVADGHTFKAKVAHPVHGRPFAPEVCMVIDAVTRVVLGWSCGLAESWMTVADAKVVHFFIS